MIPIVENIKPRRQPNVKQKLHLSKSNSSDIVQRLVGGARNDQLSCKIVMLNHRDKP
jgi:hypothetical protein